MSCVPSALAPLRLLTPGQRLYPLCRSSNEHSTRAQLLDRPLRGNVRHAAREPLAERRDLEAEYRALRLLVDSRFGGGLLPTFAVEASRFLPLLLGQRHQSSPPFVLVCSPSHHSNRPSLTASTAAGPTTLMRCRVPVFHAAKRSAIVVRPASRSAVRPGWGT